jgi:hypothetical protein
MPIIKANFWKLFTLALALCVLVGSRLSSAAPLAAGVTYYVSKAGNNAGGTSWATAWTELNQINWSVVQPGDTIYIDGGPSGGAMTYASTLTFGKSGVAGRPITLRLAADAGHNGQVRIFGGRSVPLPYCRQAAGSYSLPASPTLKKTDWGNGSGTIGDTTWRQYGINANNQSWVVVDGTKWSGIYIYGHSEGGVQFGRSASDVTIRNAEITDNGWILYSAAGTYDPDGAGGFAMQGTNITVERILNHDNGQDPIQSNGGFSNVTIRDSWEYNLRPLPNGPADTPWNYCTHSDGFQVYNGGTLSGVTFDHSILGPGLMQGTLLGQDHGGGNPNFAQVNNVTFRNVLLIGNFNDNISGYPNTNSQNWVIDHVTAWENPTTSPVLAANHHNLFIDGAGHKITNTIVYKGDVYNSATGTAYNNNCEFGLSSGTIGGRNVDPLFTAAPPTGVINSLQSLAQADFTLKANSPCAGTGSNLTSVAQLLGSAPANPTAVPAPTAASTPPPAATPAPATVVPTSTPLSRVDATPTAVPTAGAPQSTPTQQPAGTSALISPSDDAFVYQAAPDANFGGNGRLVVDGWGNFATYMRFNLSSLASRRITSASLKLKVVSLSGASKGTHYVKAVSSAGWAEGSITYNNRPAAGSAIGSYAVPAAAGGWVTVDVTAAVQAALSAGTLSIAIDSPSGPQLQLSSKEAPADRPTLVVSYT